MLRTIRFAAMSLALAGASALVVRAAQEGDRLYDAELQYQLATILFEESRYREAIDAFGRAAELAADPELAVRSRKGRVRASLQSAEFVRARQEAEALRRDLPRDSESITLCGDSLWAAGLFDEAEQAYKDALVLNGGSSRARFGLAKSLATRNRLDEALTEALAASAAAPRDGDIHHAVGDIYERMNRYEEAANAYSNYINLLPNKHRSDRASWSRAHVRFLRAFEGMVPVDIERNGAEIMHTVPFRLVKDKVIVKGRVNGGSYQDFVLDT